MRYYYPSYHTKMHQRQSLHQIFTYMKRTVSFGNKNCQKFPQNKAGKNGGARPQVEVTTFMVNTSPIKMLPGTTGLLWHTSNAHKHLWWPLSFSKLFRP